MAAAAPLSNSVSAPSASLANSASDNSSSSSSSSSSSPSSTTLSTPKTVPPECLDPRSSSFDEAAYKQHMLELYEKQQRENAEVLRRIKERQAQGLPPEVWVPEVSTPPRKSASSSSVATGGKKDKDKKKRKFKIF